MPIERPKVKKLLESIIGNGLVVAEGKDHKVMFLSAVSMGLKVDQF
jgi:hypothetical protein